MPDETHIALDGLDVHYASLFEALPGSSILLKNNAPHYTILAATPEYLLQTGTTREGITGKGVFEAFPGNPNDATDTGLNDLKTSFELVLLHKEVHYLPLQRYDVSGDDGSFSEKYWRISNKPVLDSNKEVSYIINSAEDITTEVKAAEREKQMKGLAESEQDLYSLVLQAPIGICVIDADTLVSKIVNESFVEIAGKPIEEIEGKMYWDTFREARPYYEEALNQVVREGITFRANEVEVPLLRHGKKESLNVTFVYEPVKDNLGVTRKVAVWVVDNTPQVNSRKLLEQSEQYFRQLTDTVPAIIWITERDGSCSYLNQHWYEYTGQDTGEAKGFGWLDATHPDDKAAAAKIFMEANDGQKPFTLLYRLRSKTGEYRWCKDSGSPKFSQNGAFEGFIGTVVDVHEEKRAEKKLRESEERFRSMADASPVMIWTLDESGNSTYYNSRAREFTGHTEKDLQQGKSWQVSIHPDDIEMAGHIVGTAVNKKVPYQMECRMMRADGQWRWLLNHGTPRFGSKGEYFGFVGSSIDITERKHSEQALKESESRFRALANASSDVIYRLNADWTIMYPLDGRGFLSDAYAPITNWMDKNVHPTEHETVKKAIAAAIANKSVFELEHQVVTADGAAGWTFSRAVPLLDDQGKIVEWFGTASDITNRKMIEQALKESESRFRSLADQSPIFVFIIEPNPLAPVNYWNKTWLDYTGQSLEEARGKTWEGIIHPDDLSLVMEAYLPSFANQQPYFIPAVRTKRYDGVYRWHAYKGNPRFSADGNFNGYVGVGFDVHDQKITEEKLEILVKERTKELAEANQALQQINTELQRSNANLEEFAHAASHDLKEPVRKIHFFTNQLKDQLSAQLHEGQARAFNRIENSTERMGNLIDDLLLYSHVSQKPHEKENVDLNQKVQRVLEDLELDIEEKNATIQINKLPIVKGYPRQLQQLFQNLISNGLKYSRTGTAPQISISAREATENGHAYYVLAVQDNGIGFEQEYADKIFKMFTRLHGKAEYSGTGVGLSIVKKVVENHNGFIKVTSIPNEGSTFIIMLPVE